LEQSGHLDVNRYHVDLQNKNNPYIANKASGGNRYPDKEPKARNIKPLVLLDLRFTC